MLPGIREWAIRPWDLTPQGEIRADRIPVAFDSIRLRYVNCPESPFLGSNEQNVCDGL
jgi:hypothetical protein